MRSRSCPDLRALAEPIGEFFDGRLDAHGTIPLTSLRRLLGGLLGAMVVEG
jgi:hypothetical protein